MNDLSLPGTPIVITGVATIRPSISRNFRKTSVISSSIRQVSLSLHWKNSMQGRTSICATSIFSTRTPSSSTPRMASSRRRAVFPSRIGLPSSAITVFGMMQGCPRPY